MYVILAIVFAAIAAYFFYAMRAADAGTYNLVLGVVFIILAAGCAVLFLSKRVNKGEDIHITE